MNILVLASTSKYRAEILKKLGIPFQTIKPSFDEDAEKLILQAQGASPIAVAEALSKGKALSVDAKNKTIIAGDQLLNLNGQILGKPDSIEKATSQLQLLSGQTHELITAVTIQTERKSWHLNHVTILKMKTLSPSEIDRYLKLDQPFDCAGSYKIEKSGITLFDEIKTDDFTAIQGLPLIWISKRLKELGYEFFGE